MNNLIISIGLPHSGKNEHIENVYPESCVIINAYEFIHNNEKISGEIIENTRNECLKLFNDYVKEWTMTEMEELGNENNTEENQENQENEKPQQQITFKYFKDILLSLYDDAPWKWTDFLKIASENNYAVTFLKPTKHYFYRKNIHSDSRGQIAEVLSLMKNKTDPITYIEYDDKGRSSIKNYELSKKLISDFEVALSFILNLRREFGNIFEPNKLIELIDKNYSHIVKKEKINLEKVKNLIEKNAENEKKNIEKNEKRELKKQKKNNRKNEQDEEGDEFYSNAKFVDPVSNSEDNFVEFKSKKDRNKEKKKHQNYHNSQNQDNQDNQNNHKEIHAEE